MARQRGELPGSERDPFARRRCAGWTDSALPKRSSPSSIAIAWVATDAEKLRREQDQSDGRTSPTGNNQTDRRRPRGSEAGLHAVVRDHHHFGQSGQESVDDVAETPQPSRDAAAPITRGRARARSWRALSRGTMTFRSVRTRSGTFACWLDLLVPFCGFLHAAQHVDRGGEGRVRVLPGETEGRMLRQELESLRQSAGYEGRRVIGGLMQ